MLTSERDAQRFTEFILARLQGTLAVGYQPTKLNARAAGEAVGAKLPKLLAQFVGVEAIDFTGFPDRFVLKPVNMASKHGVYLLHRREDGSYRNLFGRANLTEAAIKDRLRALLTKRRRTEETIFIAEELIEGENGPDQVPYDYKFYTFDGRPELIIQIDRNGPGKASKVAFFRADFTPLPPNLVRIEDSAVPGVPIRPRNWEAMVETASRVATQVDEPFISVDLYTNGEEVVLGELTPGPGGPFFGGLFYFHPAFDGELGGYWRRALLRRGRSVPKVTGVPPSVQIHEIDRARRFLPPTIRAGFDRVVRGVRRRLRRK